jgi:hypothetical protein
MSDECAPSTKRPRKSRSPESIAHAVRNALSKLIGVQTGGRSKSMPISAVMIQQQVNEAIQGNMSAAAFVVRLAKQTGLVAPIDTEDRRSGVLVVEGYMTEEEFQAWEESQKPSPRKRQSPRELSPGQATSGLDE